MSEECGGGDNKEAEQQVHPEALDEACHLPAMRIRYIW